MSDGRLTRRSLLGLTGVTAGALAVVTAGQTIPFLSAAVVAAPRVAGDGPQGVPINKTAAQADVLRLASDPQWRLVVEGPEHSQSFSLAELLALPQRTAVLPIACVEGWSTQATWRGVPLRQLIGAVGGLGATVTVESLQPAGPYRTTTMGAEFVSDPDTLIALSLNGAALSMDHGYPARMIAPGRPGVLQTKWLAALRVTA